MDKLVADVASRLQQGAEVEELQEGRSHGVRQSIGCFFFCSILGLPEELCAILLACLTELWPTLLPSGQQA
jgi:hypothetical protein